MENQREEQLAVDQNIQQSKENEILEAVGGGGIAQPPPDMKDGVTVAKEVELENKLEVAGAE